MAALEPDLLALLACPTCEGEVRERGEGVGCVACGRTYSPSSAIPELTVERDAAGDTIRGFYSAAPFPAYPAR